MKKGLLIVVVFWTLSGCENLWVNEAVATDQMTTFRLLWEDFDQHYAGFAVRTLDWDSVRYTTEAQINAGLSNNEFFELLGTILVDLQDIHVALVDARGQRIQFGADNPNSLNSIGSLAAYLEELADAGPVLRYGMVPDEAIGYVRISSFGSRFSLDQFERIDAVLSELRSTQGIILDIRGNGGGEAAHQKAIAQRFITGPRTYIRSQFRNGPGPEDFAPPLEDDIAPAGTFQYTQPVVVLVNRSTQSAAELLTMTLIREPHVTLVGDTTAGGLGLNVWRELPNGWNYRLTLSLVSDGEGVSYEYRGIPPDEVVFITRQDSIHEVDTQLEQAIELLR